jgi:D-psicose/D-tagatose/L-ribulose 3-epimerase
VNPVGIHALVWTDGWSESKCRRAVGLTRRAGFELIEIPLLEPREVDAAMTRRVLEEYGVGAACSLGLPFDADVSSADPAVAARGEELLLQAVRVTAEVGAAYLGGVTHSAMGKYVAPANTQGRRNCVNALRRVADRAARRGVTLGVEAVNRYESNLVNTAQQALELVEEVGAANVVVHLDSYHMNIEEHDAGEAVRLCASRLGYVHVGESHRGRLGTGTVNFTSLFAALAEIAYAGPITFESFSSAVVSDRFLAALAVWRDPWRDGEEVARHARRFIDDQLREATKARARRAMSS